METLYGTLGQSEVKDLLVGEGKPVAVNLEPGSAVIPYGTLIYRKSSGLYAPAAAGQISDSYNLLVLANDADVTTNAGIAIAAKAYERGCFKAGTVKKSDGSDGYEAVSAAEAIVLRDFGITFSPFDNWAADDVEIDNRVALSVTVTAGDHGSASVDKATAKKGETVTLTCTPASTYEVDTITVTSGGVTIGSDGKFVMGDKAVAISVSFKASA